MQMNGIKRNFSRILCGLLIAAVLFCFTGCGGSGEADSNGAPSQVIIETDGQSFGTGSTVFTLTITDAEGKELHAEIHTDQTIVGEALQELGLIGGEESPTGLYVKTVNGITADYDKSGTYWAFFVNGDYAQTGVDSTEITEGDSYAFQIEQA